MKMLAVLHAGSGSLAEKQSKLIALLSCLSPEIDTCLLGEENQLQQAAAEPFAGRLFLLPAQTEAPGPLADALAKLARQEGYQGIVFAPVESSGDIATLLAQRCGYACLTGVEALEMQDGCLYAQRAVYSNTLLGRFLLPPPFVLSCHLPRQVSAPSPLLSGGHAQTLPPCVYPSHILKHSLVSAGQQRPPSPVLLVAGMGVASRADVERIRNFAQRQGFDFGVTRPVAMRGFGGVEEIVGVSGSMLAPKITVALGVSGAAAFYVGIEKSGYILAVNINPEANICRQADAVIADDYANLLDSLFARLSPYARKGEDHA